MKREDVIVNLIEELYTTATRPMQLRTFCSSISKAIESNLTFTPPEKALFKKHLRNGSELLRKNLIERNRNGNYDHLLSDLMGFAVVIDSNGTILASNTLTHDIDAPLGTTIRDLPFAQDSIDEIYDAINHLTPLNGPTILSHCKLGSKSNLQILIKCHSPNIVENEINTNCKQVFLVSTVDITINDASIAIIAETFNLSPAEAKVAQLLGNGMQPNAIADNRSSSINTVRTQIKKILKKVGADGISDLVRTLCGFNSTYHSLQNASAISQKQTTGEIEFAKNENEIVSWQTLGPKSGVPVIILHDTWELPSFDSDLEEQCRTSNINLILVYRSGFGFAPVSAEFDAELLFEKCKQDIQYITQHQNIDKFCILGLGNGAALVPPIQSRFSNNVTTAIQTPSLEAIILTRFFSQFHQKMWAEISMELEVFLLEAFHKFLITSTQEDLEQFLHSYCPPNAPTKGKTIKFSDLRDNLISTFENGTQPIFHDLYMVSKFGSETKLCPSSEEALSGASRNLKHTLASIFTHAI